MIDLKSIKFLQVEATTKCNAWCPGCQRNINGFELNPKLIIKDLNEDHFQEVLVQLPSLEMIDFCGTYGDAAAAQNILELISIAKKHCKKILLRSNASLRSQSWWSDLAETLKDIDHEVWFCLDGLEDTHSLYRQATDWSTVINNAKSFIQNKGSAVWQFIPFKHNEHQIKDCIRLSKKLGFKRFEFVKDVRLDFSPRHYRTGQEYKIEDWSKNNKFSKYTKIKTHVLSSNCRHLTDPSLYLNADGTISNCCFFNKNRSFTTFNELPNISSELAMPHKVCLWNCGS